MSGIETVKIIVDAEKEAAEMLEKAQAKATEIRTGLDMRIKEEREHILGAAKREAAIMVQRAEEEGKLEAVNLEKDASQQVKRLVAGASAKKSTAVAKLVTIVMEGKS